MAKDYVQAIQNAQSIDEADRLFDIAKQAYDESFITFDAMTAVARANSAFRSTKRTRVFVLEECNKDISDAEKFGSLVVLFNESVHRPSIWEDAIYDAVKNRFKALCFDSERDYVLLVGPQTMIVSAIHYLSQHYPKFRALFWHATAKGYVPRVFTKESK